MMDDDEIARVVRTELDRSKSFMDAGISVERAAAYDYYTGKLFGNEMEGRSQVVSSDVQQVVDSALPALLKIFVSGDKAVEFLPRGAEDVKAAEQATMGANFVFFSQNNGYGISHDFVKDGLLAKIGVFKWKWDTSVTMEQKTYRGLDEGTLALVQQDPDTEIVNATPTQAMGPMGQPVTIYDVTVRVKKESGRVKVMVPPPEEIMISPDAMGLDVMEMPFIAHSPLVTYSDLVELGYDKAIIDELPHGEDSWSDEAISRKERNNASASMEDEDSADPSQRVYRYNECYIKIDVDGTGIAKLHKICQVGDTVLHKEPTDHIPLAIWSPKIMPHEAVGVSLAEDAMDSQLLKSTIWRGINDSMYQSIAPRMFVTGDVNMDDVLTIKPGGVIRGEPNSTLTPVSVPFVGAQAFQLLEYIDQEEESKTGISRLFQGIDPQAINKTATGVNALINQANARVELMARNAAEYGFKPLFKGILYLLTRHQHQALMVRLSNNFVPIDPETWSKEYDMTCNVGLGTGTKEQQMMQLQQFGMFLQSIAPTPFAGQLLDAKKMFNFGQKLAELSGFKDVSTFLNDPEGTEPPPPPKDPEIQKAEMQIAADKEKFAAQSQMDQQKMQADQQMQMQQAQIDAELAKYKADLDAQTKIQVERMKAEMEHEREMRRVEVDGIVGMRSAENAGKPGAVLQMDDTEGQIGEVSKHLGEASQHMAGQSEAIANGMALMAQAMAELRDAMSRPKQIIRGKDGRAIGVH